MGAAVEQKGTMMHCLTICFGPAGTTWALMFKTKEAAEAAYAREWVTPGLGIEVVDDFEQNITIKTDDVHAVMLEDMSLSKLAHIERALHNVRTQAEGNKMAQADPALQHLTRGPGIISPVPMGNGRFPAG
jgi:hypothetical protein